MSCDLTNEWEFVQRELGRGNSKGPAVGRERVRPAVQGRAGRGGRRGRQVEPVGCAMDFGPGKLAEWFKQREVT